MPGQIDAHEREEILERTWNAILQESQNFRVELNRVLAANSFDRNSMQHIRPIQDRMAGAIVFPVAALELGHVLDGMTCYEHAKFSALFAKRNLEYLGEKNEVDRAIVLKTIDIIRRLRAAGIKLSPELRYFERLVLHFCVDKKGLAPNRIFGLRKVPESYEEPDDDPYNEMDITRLPEGYVFETIPLYGILRYEAITGTSGNTDFLQFANAIQSFALSGGCPSVTIDDYNELAALGLRHDFLQYEEKAYYDTVTTVLKLVSPSSNGHSLQEHIDLFEVLCSLYDYPVFGEPGKFFNVVVTPENLGFSVEQRLQKLDHRLEIAKLTDYLLQGSKTSQLCLKSMKELQSLDPPPIIIGGFVKMKERVPNSSQKLLLRSAMNYALITGPEPQSPSKGFSLDIKSLTGFLAHSQYWAVKSHLDSRKSIHQKITDILSPILEKNANGVRVLRDLENEPLNPSEISKVKYAYALYQAEIKNDSLCKRALEFWHKPDRIVVQIPEEISATYGREMLKLQFRKTIGDVFFKASCSRGNEQLRNAYEKLGNLAKKIRETINFSGLASGHLKKMCIILTKIRDCIEGREGAMSANQLIEKIEKCFSASEKEQLAVNTHNIFLGHAPLGGMSNGLVQNRNGAFLGAWTEGRQAAEDAPAAVPLGAAQRPQTGGVGGNVAIEGQGVIADQHLLPG
jgi:hypothetical protein